MNDNEIFAAEDETLENAEALEESSADGNDSQQDENNGFYEELFSWIKTIAFAVIFAWIITTFIIVNAKVPTGSMKNTINEGDRVIANRLAYVFGEPERFDIVVFKYPDNEDELFIKRIIGLPGETVEIKDGKVYINGSEEPLDDSFIPEPMDPTRGAGVYEVPEGSYFMLGDNRNNSQDSRFWVNKYVKKEKILGKAIFKYFPGIKILTNK